MDGALSVASCTFVLLLGCLLCTDVKPVSASAGCVATYFRAAGVSAIKSESYERSFARKDIDTSSLQALPASVLGFFGVRNSGDVLKLSNCFSGKTSACSTFKFCTGSGKCSPHNPTGKAPSYRCSCKAGFKGDECQTDACFTTESNLTCQNGGKCVRLSTAPYYRCECRHQYIGKQCQSAKDNCNPQNPCAHGGRCRSLTTGFTCDCPRGYVGSTCQNHLLTSQEFDERFAKQQSAMQSRFAQQDSANRAHITKLESAILSRLGSMQSNILAGLSSPKFPGGIRFFREDVTWFAARDKCITLGGALTVPKSSSEQTAALHQASQQGHSGCIWIDVTDLKAEGRWRDQEGNHLTYSKWGPGEPNNQGEEDCGALYTDSQAWNDVSCGSSCSFICRFP
eukprot:scpid79034/ scgid23776/ Cadherin-related tumor suppressor; Protein fat